MLVYEQVTAPARGGEALRGLSLQVETGAIFGLIGPAGCGKNAALRAAAGLRRLSSGRIRWHSVDLIAQKGERRRLVCFLPAEPENGDHQSVAETAEFFSNIQGLEGLKGRSLAMESLRFAGLTELANEDVNELSRTEKRRLAIARAYIEEPELLLVEDWDYESGSGAALTGLLLRLAERGCTVLLTAERAAAVTSICSHLGRMKDGRLTATDLVEELQERMRRTSPVEIEMAGQTEETVRRLREDAAVRSLTRRGDRIEVMLEGGADEEQRLLRQLVAAGLPVRGFMRRPGDPDRELYGRPVRKGKVVSTNDEKPDRGADADRP